MSDVPFLVIYGENTKRIGACGSILNQFLAFRIDTQSVVVEVVLALASAARHNAVRREDKLVVEHIGLGVAVGTLRVESIQDGRRREIAVAHNNTSLVI